MEISNVKNNPAYIIKQNYQQLMTIDDPDELKNYIMNLVKPTINHGFSKQNFARFQNNLLQSYNRGIDSLKMYLTNFMLKADGLGVTESYTESLAALINEDVNDYQIFTESQSKMIKLVEKYGYRVKLLK